MTMLFSSVVNIVSAAAEQPLVDVKFALDCNHLPPI
jgi:hypothetical protein